MVGEMLGRGIAQFTKSLIYGGLGATLASIVPAWISFSGGSIAAALPVTIAATPSQTGLTVPSLWWAKEQFGGNLLNTWSIYPKQGNRLNRVDLLVRRDVWNQIDYLQRYTFVNQFGLVASDYGYNLRVLDQQNNLLATYTCNFSRANPNYLEGVRDSRGQRVSNYASDFRSSPGSQNLGELACRIGLEPSDIPNLGSSPPTQFPGFPPPEYPATESGTGQ